MIILVGMLSIYVIWNFITYFMYGSDKKRAVKNKRRISEKALIISSFCFGGIGAFVGMKNFKHKTKQLKFNILIPLSIFTNLLMFAGLIYLLFYVKIIAV